MVQRTVDHFYPSYADAVQGVADLTAAGIPAGNVSLIESGTDARLPSGVLNDTAQSPAVTGATLGAAIGGGIGALDGVGAITIPYTEPLVATGWVLPCVVFAVVFAVIGAAVGAVTKLGVSNRSAHRIASRLKQGQHLVLVQVDDSQVAMVERVLAASRPLPASQRLEPEPAYTMEPTGDTRTVPEERAAIRRAETDIQYSSE